LPPGARPAFTPSPSVGWHSGRKELPHPAAPPDHPAILPNHRAAPPDRLANFPGDPAKSPGHLAKPLDHSAKLTSHPAKFPDGLAKLTDHLAIPTDDLAKRTDHPAPAAGDLDLPPNYVDNPLKTIKLHKIYPANRCLGGGFTPKPRPLQALGGFIPNGKIIQPGVGRWWPVRHALQILSEPRKPRPL
jgi:hypothetical protein